MGAINIGIANASVHINFFMFMAWLSPILGSNFTAVTAVDFGGVPASNFVINSSTSITATAPAAEPPERAGDRERRTSADEQDAQPPAAAC